MQQGPLFEIDPETGWFNIRSCEGEPLLLGYSVAVQCHDGSRWAEERLGLEARADDLRSLPSRTGLALSVSFEHLDGQGVAWSVIDCRNEGARPITLRAIELLSRPPTAGWLFQPQGPGSLRVLSLRDRTSCTSRPSALVHLRPGEHVASDRFTAISARRTALSLVAGFAGSAEGTFQVEAVAGTDAIGFSARLPFAPRCLQPGESLSGVEATLHLRWVEDVPAGLRSLALGCCREATRRPAKALSGCRPAPLARPKATPEPETSGRLDTAAKLVPFGLEYFVLSEDSEASAQELAASARAVEAAGLRPAVARPARHPESAAPADSRGASFGAAGIRCLEIEDHGPDMHLDPLAWQAVQQGVGLRFFLQGVPPGIDPGVVLLRPPLPLEGARSIASFAALCGASLFAGDSLAELPPDRLDILKRALPAFPETARPLDWRECETAPRTWLLEVDRGAVTFRVLGLFNGHDRPRLARVPLRACGLARAHLFDYWEQAYLGCAAESTELVVPAHGCRILALAPPAALVFLSSSRHLAQGVVDVSDLHHQQGQLCGRVQLVAGFPTTLTFLHDRGAPARVLARQESGAGDLEVSIQRESRPEGELLHVLLLARSAATAVFTIQREGAPLRPPAAKAAGESEPLSIQLLDAVPGVLEVHWTGDGEADEACHEQLARARASQQTGTDVILRPPPPRATLPAPVPAALRAWLDTPLHFERAAEGFAVGSPGCRRALRVGEHPEAPAAAVLAAAGGGCVVLLAPALEAPTEITDLYDRRRRQERVERWQQRLRDQLLPRNRAASFEAAVHPRLEPAVLDVASPSSEAAFHYRTGGGGALVAVGLPREFAACEEDLGRQVRGHEEWSLLLPRAVDGPEQIVILRRTGPGDQGKLVRVYLDEEDLGPWRLGGGATANDWTHDTFRIASELWQGQRSVTLRLALEAGVELTSTRYMFLREPEPAGLWLTDLEPATPAEAESSREAGAATLRLPLVLGPRLFLRGLGGAGRVVFRFQVRGSYRWLQTWVGQPAVSPVRQPSRFEIRVNGQRLFRLDDVCATDPPRPARVQLPPSAELELIHEGLTPGAFADPVLLRQ